MPNQISNNFSKRHIGVNDNELHEMLKVINVESLDQLINETIPDSIRSKKALQLPDPLTEHEYLSLAKNLGSKNKVFSSFIGQGYYGTITPSVILRNIFENPGWYTQYTPYQAEISQGRLEALLNFQTMVSDLTGMPIANASLLDEGTAAAEAMTMVEGIHNKKKKNQPAKKFFVDNRVFKHTQEIVKTRAYPFHLEVVVGDWQSFDFGDDYFGVLIQYPDEVGNIHNYAQFTENCHLKDIQVVVAADIMSLALLTPPGEWGADVVIGNTQRFGVPMGFGGPHAAYFATKEENKRIIPGRIIGLSIDKFGNQALRMALQTREQHIRREKATSNICTAQALLAIMAGMYAVFHGPKGIKNIATEIHNKTKYIADNLSKSGIPIINSLFFDTITFKAQEAVIQRIQSLSVAHEMNFFYGIDGHVSLSCDESHTLQQIKTAVKVILEAHDKEVVYHEPDTNESLGTLKRKSDILSHPIFSSFHTESKMMRYIKRLENKDLSLVHSMISLGSCTMKLNAATEMLPVSWPEFAAIHPFAPADQTKGYSLLFEELEAYLCEITGFSACSLQPNSGAQGEYSGLLTIKTYHETRNDFHRNIALIPSSAHGTNPASAVMCGMEVVVVACDDNGNIDLSDLTSKAVQHRDNLSCLMITYPSTHGVFETAVKDICKIIHDNGGLVYMDGANMNAQVGLTSPGIIGADVCHLNLHKTFAIPHGGGGPGMGPICVNEKLAPFLPTHTYVKTGGALSKYSVSSAPYGSASILLISYAYIRMLGATGVTDATKYAILNANYIKSRLENAYSILYLGEMGRAAHEMIVDLRQFKAVGISAEDVAKRLMDYGFHAPTLSFPVAGTIMIEPTESEDKEELDRFCNALLQIRQEIDEVAAGNMNAESNTLTNAPHTADLVTADVWTYDYSREKAAYPLPYLRSHYKFWPSVARIDSAFGDRNLICTCPPMENYMEEA